MASKIAKKKGFGEMPLYRSISIFMVLMTPMLFNMRKDVKLTMGYKAVDTGTEALNNMSKSYNEKDTGRKLEYIKDSVGKITFLELLLKLLFELGELTEAQSANLSIHMADIKLQLTGWRKKLEGGITEEKANN